MGARHMAAFMLVCGVVIAGLDYHRHAKAADADLGFDGYLASVKSRLADFRQERKKPGHERRRRAAWEAGGRSFLPPAPDGWARHSLLTGDYTAVWPEMPQGQDLEEVAARGWIYVNGGETVWIETRLREQPKSDGMTGSMMSVLAAENGFLADYEGYAVIGGVGFVEAIYPVRPKAQVHKVFEGWIGLGDEIEIQVRADASEQSVRSLLSEIDYDGLNALLKQPVPSVGSGVTVASGRETELSENMLDLRAAFIRLRGKVASERIRDMSGLSMLADAVLGGIAPEGTFDITGGKVTDMHNAMQLGYRNALDLMIDQDLRRTGQTGDEPVQKADAEPELIESIKHFFSTTDHADAGNDVNDAATGSGADAQEAPAGRLVCTVIGSSKRCRAGG